MDSLQYYKVPPQQRVFNETKASHFLKNAAAAKLAYYDPPDFAKSGCNPAYLGLHYGQFKVFASDISLAFASHVANVPCFEMHRANVLQPCCTHATPPAMQDLDSRVFFAK